MTLIKKMAWMLPHGGGGHHMYMGEGFVCSEDNLKPKGRHRKKLLYKTVLEQMEFYFSDANLSKDRFLRQLVEEDPYVSLEVFLSFNKINRLVSTVEGIAKAVKKSDILELSEDSLKVRRTTPIKLKENEDDCTLYVENLPPEISHDELKKVFSEFGKVVYVSIPKYRHTHASKGFAFVEFDTPQDADETVRIFKEKGSCLSPHMLPEKLCSIRTFEDQSESGPQKQHSDKVRDENNSEDHLSGLEKEGDESKLEPMLETKQSIKSSRKRKHEAENDVEAEHAIKKEKPDVENKSNNKIDLSAEDIAAPHQIKIEEEDELNDQPEASENESGQENKNDDPSTDKKKKKNRKKKKRPKEKDLFANGMVVLSKKEWKRLRNKYLNMQRVNMRRVKQQVLEARFMRRQPYNPPGSDHGRDEEMRPPPPPVDAPKPRVTFTPGVIVGVKFNDPMIDVKAFKAEARTQSGVQYVDVHEGSSEAYLRCAGPAEAQHLLQSKLWKNMAVLSGTEESDYWKKIAKDREAKLGNKVKVVKERGKKKLLRKAEIVKATHLHFEN